MQAHPAKALRFFNAVTRVLEPAIVEPRSGAIVVRDPRELRDGVRQRPELRFAVADDLFHPLMVRDVGDGAEDIERLSVCTAVRAPPIVQPMPGTIRPEGAKLLLEVGAFGDAASVGRDHLGPIVGMHHFEELFECDVLAAPEHTFETIRPVECAAAHVEPKRSDP